MSRVSGSRGRVRVSHYGHEHELCVTIARGAPPDLCCRPEEGVGYISGSPSSGGCQLPMDLIARVDERLRNDYQESRRRGCVLIAA